MLAGAREKVAASSHATDRAAKRVTALAGMSRHQVSVWVEREALLAVEEGRKAKRMPGWCVEGNRVPFRTRVHGMIRFAWDEDQTAVFLIRKTHEKEHERGAVWLVVTVFAPRTGTVVVQDVWA